MSTFARLAWGTCFLVVLPFSGGWPTAVAAPGDEGPATPRLNESNGRRPSTTPNRETRSGDDGSGARSAERSSAAQAPSEESPRIVKPTGPARHIYDAFQLTQDAKEDADYVAIIEMLDEALKSDGLTPAEVKYARRLKGWSHNKHGEAMLGEKKDALALVQFELAVELNPDHWKARQNRGVSYAQLGKINEAIEDFSQVIALNRGYANAWFNRGELYFQQGDPTAAVRDYSEAIRRSPEDPIFYQVRGNALHQLRRFNDAVDDYTRAIELADKVEESEKRAIPYVYRGDTHTMLGHFEKAAEDYRQAIQLSDKLGRAYQSTAWLMATCPDEEFRDPPRAIQAAKRAIELDGQKRYQYFETLAAALASSGQFDQAIQAQQQAIALAPPSASAVTRQRLKMYEEGQPYRMRPRTARGNWSPATIRRRQ